RNVVRGSGAAPTWAVGAIDGDVACRLRRTSAGRRAAAGGRGRCHAILERPCTALCALALPALFARGRCADRAARVASLRPAGGVSKRRAPGGLGAARGYVAARRRILVARPRPPLERAGLDRHPQRER